MMHRRRLVFATLASVCLACAAESGTAPRDDAASGPQREPDKRHEKLVYRASLQINLDRKKLNSAGIGAADAVRSIEQFLKEHKSFSLAELEALKLSSSDNIVSSGRTTAPLKDCAKIEVQFSKLPSSPDK